MIEWANKATGDNYKKQIECAAKTLLFNEQICTVVSLKMREKGASFKNWIFETKHREWINMVMLWIEQRRECLGPVVLLLLPSAVSTIMFDGTC